MSSSQFCFSEAVLEWFDRHGRKDLPWQRDPSSYRVWISEIMLQQTRVSSVIDYFQRFVERFPDIAALANAPMDEVLHYWSGLGYYARARNLHKAALMIRDQYQGVFPRRFEEVIGLPGIGRSTAGAILSLAQSQRYAILDGNVKRVLARFHAIEGWPGQATVQAMLWQFAEQHLPKNRLAHYTQAMMDLGATRCTRVQPLCQECPLSAGCAARLQGRVHELPTPKPSKPLPTRKTQMLLLQNEHDEILLEKRPDSGIWGGLWSFPECAADTNLADWCQDTLGFQLERCKVWPEVRHTFSHFHLSITPTHAHIEGPPKRVMESQRYVWYNSKRPQAYGLAAPVIRLLAKMDESMSNPQ